MPELIGGAALRDPVVQVLRPGDALDPGADIVCFLDSDDWPVDGLRSARSPGRKLVFLVDTGRGRDMSEVARSVDGICQLVGDAASSVLSLWRYWHGVEDDDPEEPGAVSREEFLERIRRSALPAGSPDSRDDPVF